MNQRKSWMDKVMETILGNKDKNFQEILIERDVVDEIIQIARQSHPLEFVAMLEGKIKNGVLRIDGLVFSSGDRSNQGAVINTLMIPITTGTVGSVHSHPGPNATPSAADLQFFAKKGLFHIIIAEPYIEGSMIGYDTFGRVTNFKIV
ncbi:Mov34/MPN/PAD-1 family protein [Methanobacterium ferruginis]|uniref:Mov34/MPN/PAD-1 family protein n=1 Tax=Methanobacterium ferruginis TaxID=710191 RepID=UPI00257421DC|nr:Mov34/MPN/PAD-1 family protein [Methanobacterium ferruginis]